MPDGRADLQVAIIDDSEVYAELLSAQLAAKSIASTVYLLPETFLAELPDKRFDAILLDLRMPKMSGIEVLARVRKSYGRLELPVIVVSSSTGEDDLIEAFQRGANDFLVKPVQPQAAVSRIEAHSAMCRLHTADAEKEQLSAVNSMIVTYNHYINNPLSVALWQAAALLRQSPDDEGLQRLMRSLERIRKIVVHISDAGQDPDIQWEPYAGSSKMLKISRG